MEELSKYNPDGSNLRLAQMKMKEILDNVVLIFERNNIPYWLDGGTALGAVRHGGFIPWDDDLDIDIYHKDLKKAFKALKRELPNNLHLQNKFNTKNYKHSFFKIRDKYSDLHEVGAEGLDHRGIFIDIFPIKGTNSNIQNKINLLQRSCNKYSKEGLIYKYLVFRFLVVILNVVKSFFKVNAFVTPEFEQYCYPIELLTPLSKINFEGSMYSCVNDLDLYLKIHYGDYMKIPNCEDRITHSPKIDFYYK